MLTIRFQRTGRANDPSFRIIVTEKTASPKAGKNVATVGSHNPKTKHTLIDAEAVKGWLAKGAQASGTVHNLLISKGIIEGKKVNVLQRKSSPKKEEAPAAPASSSNVTENPKSVEVSEKTEEVPAQ